MTASPVRYRRRGQDGHTVLAWRVTAGNVDDVAHWCHGRVEYRLTVPGDVRVRPHQSTVAARMGDYIVKAAEGEWWYPVKRLLFDLSYEPDDSDPST